MKKNTYLTLIDAVFTGTSFTKKGLLYTWTKVKSTGVVYRNDNDDIFVETIDKRKINMITFDGIVLIKNDIVQVWDKGLRNSDKELVLTNFPDLSKAELNNLDKNTLKALVNAINKETKKEIFIQPVITNLSSADWKELSLLNNDLESSDYNSRVIPENDTEEDNTLYEDWKKELVNNALKDALKQGTN